MGKFTMAAVMIASSAVGTMAAQGTYHYMREKKNMGRWKAGLASGALLASIGVAALWLTGGLDAFQAQMAAQAQLPAPQGTVAGLGMVIPQQIGGIYVSPYKGLSGIVARKVAGY
jgi:4-amino-4-deoxy-L-arabinose transferase-like glycosyltransferase